MAERIVSPSDSTNAEADLILSEALSSTAPLNDEDRDNVLQYVSELVPIAGCIYTDQVEETMHRGRRAVRRLTNGSPVLLPLADCADVLALMSRSELRSNPLPTSGDEARHYAGLMRVMSTLEESLRAALNAPARREAEPAPGGAGANIPAALQAHLERQQQRAAELGSLLERLEDDDDMPMCMAIAVRMAWELNDELDSTAISKALEGRPEEAGFEEVRQ